MDDQHRVRANLQQLIVQHRADYAALSRLLGRNSAYIQQFIKRGSPRRLSENDRHILCEYFGVDERVLGGPPSRPGGNQDDLIIIPRLDVRASAGAGSFPDNEQAIAHVGFSPTWLKQLSGSAPQDLSIIRVQGDSMSPTLSDGDDIMVDRSDDGRRLRDGIYVLRLEDSLMVKRVAVHPGSRKLSIYSDNSAYPTWSDCAADSVEVIGRVVWAGRRIS